MSHTHLILIISTGPHPLKSLQPALIVCLLRGGPPLACESFREGTGPLVDRALKLEVKSVHKLCLKNTEARARIERTVRGGVPPGLPPRYIIPLVISYTEDFRLIYLRGGVIPGPPPSQLSPPNHIMRGYLRATSTV